MRRRDDDGFAVIIGLRRALAGGGDLDVPAFFCNGFCDVSDALALAVIALPENIAQRIGGEAGRETLAKLEGAPAVLMCVSTASMTRRSTCCASLNEVSSFCRCASAARASRRRLVNAASMNCSMRRWSGRSEGRVRDDRELYCGTGEARAETYRSVRLSEKAKITKMAAVRKPRAHALRRRVWRIALIPPAMLRFAS